MSISISRYFLPKPYAFYILSYLKVRYTYLMSIEAGGIDIYVPPDDPVVIRRREDIFVQIGLGLLRLHHHPETDRLTAIFENPDASDGNRQHDINQLRAIIIEASMRPSAKMPMLGIVLGEAFKIAESEENEIPILIQEYVKLQRPNPSPLYQKRRNSPTITEVA